MIEVVRGTVISKSAEPPVQPSEPYSSVATLSFSESTKPEEDERTRMPSLRGVGLAGVLSDLTEIVLHVGAVDGHVAVPDADLEGARLGRVGEGDVAGRSPRRSAVRSGTSASAAARMKWEVGSGGFHKFRFFLWIGLKQVYRAARRVADVGVRPCRRWPACAAPGRPRGPSSRRGSRSSRPGPGGWSRGEGTRGRRRARPPGPRARRGRERVQPHVHARVERQRVDEPVDDALVGLAGGGGRQDGLQPVARSCASGGRTARPAGPWCRPWRAGRRSGAGSRCARRG